MADTPTGRRGARNAARTPTGRLNVEPPSSSRPVYTPLNHATPTSARRGASSAGRANAPTPHAAAALRAQSLRRRAMLTPGRNRGQQGTAVQRDSPMGLLQQLGRQLAPTTRPIESSSPRDSISSSVPRPRRPTALAQEVDDDEDPELPEMQAEDESEPELTRPRLSLPINDDDDDDDTLPIPQPSEVPYDTSMNQASERGRRTTYGRPPRISGISAPGSEFADETGEPSDFLGLFENVQAGPGVDTSYYHEEDSRRETIGGQSEIALPMPVGYEDQSTFQMSEADPALGQTSPILPENARAGNAARGDVTGNVTLAVDDDLDDHDGGAAFDGGAGDYDAMPYVEELSRAGSSRRVSRIEPLDEEDDELELAFEQPRRRSSVREAQSLLRAPGRGRPKGSVTRKKVKKLSQLGAEYPPLPPNFVKRVAQRALQNSSLNNPRISADVVTALTQASDWFFEQMGDDLGAYAEHAGRDAIDDADVITLMRRQRQVTNEATMFSLAQRHLPRELLQEIRMPMPLIDEED